MIIINMSPMNDDACDGERFPITFFFGVPFELCSCQLSLGTNVVNFH